LSKSHRLHLKDVRAVFRLVGECRELGADSLTWRTHLANQMCRLLGARMGVVVEFGGERQEVGTILQSVEVGWDSVEVQSLWLRNQQEQLYRTDPIVQRVFLHLFPHGTCRREQAVPDRTWYGSALFNDFHRAFGIDDSVTSFHPATGTGRAVCSLVLYRSPGDRRYTQWQSRLVELCYDEIGRLEGTVLATSRDPSVSGLSPRLRQVLDALLEGDSEKQVGRRLGLRPDTVREYVLAIYRRFGAHTRAELMAHFVRRSGLRLPGSQLGGAAGSEAKS
jgi:DNA-binding CsgD family transcriptional regulator